MKIRVRPRSFSDSDDVKSAAVWNEDERPPQLRKLLRPFFICLAISGCYTYDIDYETNGVESAKGRKYRLIGLLYRIFCFLIGLGSLAKHAVAFFTLPSTFVHFNFIVLTWTLVCVLFFAIAFKSGLSKYGHQRKAFTFWDETIRSDMEQLGINFPNEKIKKRQHLYLIICGSILVMNSCGIALLSADIFSDGLGEFFAAPFHSSPAVLTISISAMLLIAMMWLVPVFYVILVSTLLSATFGALNKFLEKHIANNVLKVTHTFKRIRHLHLNLSRMISELDKDFGYYFAVIFVLNVGTSCFILYQMLKTPLATIHLVMYMFWLSATTGSLVAIAVFAALVHESVSILIDSP